MRDNLRDIARSAARNANRLIMVLAVSVAGFGSLMFLFVLALFSGMMTYYVMGWDMYMFGSLADCLRVAAWGLVVPACLVAGYATWTLFIDDVEDQREIE
jgi:hypothetical protein